ncbi:MAG: cytochrome c3 family protein [Chitinophagaceae bacterium]
MRALLCNIKKQSLITFLLFAMVAAGSILCSAYSKSNIALPANELDTSYAGSAACINCHKAIADSFFATAHYTTSRIAAEEFIKGSVVEGKNHFSYNQFVDVKIEKKDSAFFQTVYINGEPSRSQQMDIVVGSGKKGQTFLYWNENLLYQLPVSYYIPMGSWCNSPGYPASLPRFNRLVSGRCLECHASNAVIEDAGKNVNYFDRNSIVYGISCERCHGPSAKHVAFHTGHPAEKIGHFVVNEKKLDRQQNLDRCALCHAGVRNQVKPAFSFKTGDRLDDFSLPVYNADSAASLDVHGNQYGLLMSSKCFKKSQLTCSSCHSSHAREVNDPVLYSRRCAGCHNSAANLECKIKPVTGMILTDNCIDCHMPALPSKAIFLQLQDAAKSTADLVRTHRIAIYPAAVKEFIRQANAKHKN